MPFFQGASSVNASHGTFNDVTGDQTFTDNSNHSATTNSNNTTTTDTSSKVTDSSVHHSMGKITSIQCHDAHLTNFIDQACLSLHRLSLSQPSSSAAPHLLHVRWYSEPTSGYSLNLVLVINDYLPCTYRNLLYVYYLHSPHQIQQSTHS